MPRGLLYPAISPAPSEISRACSAPAPMDGAVFGWREPPPKMRLHPTRVAAES
jgi:hypothetical protein